ncbi:MAG: NHLP bacteriocin export ABC transporter permease/ATPase subunit [Synoicihabitans sp.]
MKVAAAPTDPTESKPTPWPRLIAQATGLTPELWTRNRSLGAPVEEHQAGNTTIPPFLINQSAPAGATVFLVVGGTLRLDAELIKDGHFQKRRMLGLFGPEQIVVLPTELPPELRLYASGEPEASVIALPLTKFLAAQKISGCMAPIRRALLKWSLRLQNFEEQAPPTDLGRKLALAPGENRKLRAGQILVVADTPLWIPTQGLELLPPPASSRSLPPYWFLHRGNALRNATDEPLRPPGLGPAAVFNDPEAESHLLALQDYLWEETLKRWQQRYQERADAENFGLNRQELESQSTRGRLLGLLSGRRSTLPRTSNQVLRAAFHLIASKGWTPTLPRFVEDDYSMSLLKRIAASSGLITREIRLSGKWWEHDHDTFLTFDGDNHPLVLRYHSGAYQVWDPRTEKETRLTPEQAQQLPPQALCFHRQLPAQKLSLRDLVTFEAQQVKGEIFALIAIALIGSALTAALPMASAYIVDSVLPSGLTGMLTLIGAMLLGLGLFQVGFGWAESLLMARLKLKLSLASTAALWHRVLHFPRSVLSNFAAGDVAVRVSALLGMQQFFQGITQGAITLSFRMLSSLGVVLWVNFQLGLAVAGFGLVSIVAAIGFSYWQVRAFVGGEKSMGIVNSYILEIFGGIHKIKAAGAEEACLRQWADRYSRLQNKMLTTARIGISANAFQVAWISLSTGLLYYLIITFQSADFEPAGFIAFLGAFAVFSMCLGGICSMLLGAGMQIPMLKFIEPLMKNIPDLRIDRQRPQGLKGRIRAENASFAYPRQNELSLQGINLDVHPGTFIAVVGPSGSGKTTLARLLSGLEPPRAGHVFLDDYELDTLDPEVLRSTIAVTPQDFRLVPGTLFENIRGATQANREQVVNAARLAGIADELERLPMGLHTVVTGQAEGFSGGQIQRIALARALVRQPRILILDEATSALDNNLQTQIFANLKTINCSVIFIAHRLKLASQADRIVVLHKGKLAQQGTHDELIGQNGPYAEMWKGESS